jgi:RNA polymerase sigma factor (sigma-70 family)
MEPTGLEAVFLANRTALLGFLRAHGAVEDAEDVLHELWLRVRTAPTGPIAAPLAYLYRAANNLMLDRYRAARQASMRDTAWSELAQLDQAPDAERLVSARGELAAVAAALAELPPRAAAIFRRHRIDGVAQRAIAAERGVSLSTVEGDLRLAYAAVLAVRRRFDEA